MAVCRRCRYCGLFRRYRSRRLRRLLRLGIRPGPLWGHGQLRHPRHQWSARVRPVWRGPGTISRRRHVHRRWLAHPVQHHRRPQSTGVYQIGGIVNAYNSLFADNGYTGSAPARRVPITPTLRRGSAVAYNSLFQSTPSAYHRRRLVRRQRGSLSERPASNGGPTQTIALVAGSRPSVPGRIPSTESRCSPISAAISRRPVGHRRLPAGQSGRGSDSHARRDQRLGVRLRPDELHVHDHLYQRRGHRAVVAGRCGRDGRSTRRRIRSRRPWSARWPMARPIPGAMPSRSRSRTDHAAGWLVDLGRQRHLHRRTGRLAGQRHGRRHGPDRSVGTFQVETGKIAITKYGLPATQDRILYRYHHAHKHRHVGLQRADLHPVQSAGGGRPRECHRHL